MRISRRLIGLEHPGSHGAASAAGQTEFPLRVAVCAWCKPRDRGATLGALSHGICPRHFREIKIQLQISRSGRDAQPAGLQARASRKRDRAIRENAQLRFPFPAPVNAASHLSA